MGRRGGRNGRRGKMKEGEQGGKVEVDFHLVSDDWEKVLS